MRGAWSARNPTRNLLTINVGGCGNKSSVPFGSPQSSFLMYPARKGVDQAHFRTRHKNVWYTVVEVFNVVRYIGRAVPWLSLLRIAVIGVIHTILSWLGPSTMRFAFTVLACGPKAERSVRSQEPAQKYRASPTYDTTV